MKKLLALSIIFYCNNALCESPKGIKTYELAHLIKQLMVSTDPVSSKDSYLEMKEVFGKLKQAEPSDLAPTGNETFPRSETDFFYIYQGRVNLLAKGKPLATDRMQDNPSWRVWVAGQKALVTNVWLMSENSAKAKGGPSYLRSQGLTLDPLACQAVNGGNYSAYYKVSAPGKRPAILEISASSGSGGTWYSYQVTWFSIKASELAPESEIGLCKIDD